MTETIAIALHGGTGANPKCDHRETQAHMTMLVEQAKGWLLGGMAALDAFERAVAMPCISAGMKRAAAGNRLQTIVRTFGP